MVYYQATYALEFRYEPHSSILCSLLTTYYIHTILSKAIADMLLMNGALTQHQCCCCCHKNLYDINKVLGVNREKNPSKQNLTSPISKEQEPCLTMSSPFFFLIFNQKFCFDWIFSLEHTPNVFKILFGFFVTELWQCQRAMLDIGKAAKLPKIYGIIFYYIFFQIVTYYIKL